MISNFSGKLTRLGAGVFLFASVDAVSGTDIRSELTREQFAAKRFQLTVIKTPDKHLAVPKNFLFIPQTKYITDQVVILEVDRKVVAAFVTSTGNTAIGKNTPEGYFLISPSECSINKESSIYKSEMDWAMMFCAPYGIHSTTESHYCELGAEASAGCARLLRSSATDLFKMATGLAPVPGLGTVNFVGAKGGSQAAIQILGAGAATAEFWNSFDDEQRKTIDLLLTANRAEIQREITKFEKEGDTPDDPAETWDDTNKREWPEAPRVRP